MAQNRGNDNFDPTEHWHSAFGSTSDAGERTPSPPIEIPLERISAEAIEALIDAFILREGTDYGKYEVDHGTKHQQVRTQIENERVKIVFDPDSESVTLLKVDDWKKLTDK